MCGNCTCKPKESSVLEMGKQNLNGSHLVGRINSNYENIVRVFGQPNLEQHDGKTDAIWNGKIFGVPFNIYNWKNGHSYGYDIDIQDIKEWNIGGFGNEAEALVKKYFVWKLEQV